MVSNDVDAERMGPSRPHLAAFYVSGKEYAGKAFKIKAIYVAGQAKSFQESGKPVAPLDLAQFRACGFEVVQILQYH
ncbi:hypothetical protein A6779_17605 [Marinobacter adhaerens]|nr:hypothetical protein A6779_17605 [Marinobacter adhaerens]